MNYNSIKREALNRAASRYPNKGYLDRLSAGGNISIKMPGNKFLAIRN